MQPNEFFLVFIDKRGKRRGRMEDHELIDLYWNRCDKAILETSKKYGRYCNTIAYNILKSAQDSEECVNDTYLKTWNAIPKDKPKIFSAYLGKITRNLAINRYHKKKAQKRGSGQINLVLEELENCISSNHSIENQIESQGIREILNQFLEDLKKEDRIIFVRRYWYVDSIKDISKRLGLSESKIKSVLFRARKKLKQYLEEKGVYL